MSLLTVNKNETEVISNMALLSASIVGAPEHSPKNIVFKEESHFKTISQAISSDQIFEIIAAANSIRVLSPANEYKEPLVLINL